MTGNLRHFRAGRLVSYAVAAQHPDTFVGGLFEIHTDRALEAVREHRTELRNPPCSSGEHLAAPERLGLIRVTSLILPHLVIDLTGL